MAFTTEDRAGPSPSDGQPKGAPSAPASPSLPSAPTDGPVTDVIVVDEVATALPTDGVFPVAACVLSAASWKAKRVGHVTNTELTDPWRKKLKASTPVGVLDRPSANRHALTVGGAVALAVTALPPLTLPPRPLQPATAFNLAEFARSYSPIEAFLAAAAPLSGREGGQAIRPFRGASSLSAFAGYPVTNVGCPSLADALTTPTPSPLLPCPAEAAKRTQGRYFPLLSHQLAAYRLFQDPNAETGRYFSPMAFVLRVREIDCIGFDAPPAVLMVLYSERLGSRGLTMMHV
ncbi:hypothetical protein GQ600_11749 [Phytophthora cactorum]|nr:hypothetical protein GQ600_11749 [Phytophthora cactorum]